MPPALVLTKSERGAWKMPVAASELEVIIGAMLEAAGVFDAVVDLALLEDAAMELLHAESLGCFGPTNILAFPEACPVAPPPGLPRPLGSLALSVDTLERESFLYGQDLCEHCIRLLAHGLAHLLGHDHGPVMDVLSQRMEIAALTVYRDI